MLVPTLLDSTVSWYCKCWRGKVASLWIFRCNWNLHTSELQICWHYSINAAVENYFLDLAPLKQNCRKSSSTMLIKIILSLYMFRIFQLRRFYSLDFCRVIRLPWADKKNTETPSEIVGINDGVKIFLNSSKFLPAREFEFVPRREAFPRRAIPRVCLLALNDQIGIAVNLNS